MCVWIQKIKLQEEEVEFVKWEYNVGMLVDLIINGKKMSSYLV